LRSKPLMMAVQSNRIRGKKTASLRDKQIKLRQSAEKQRKSQF